jgi:hypothetical protein
VDGDLSPPDEYPRRYNVKQVIECVVTEVARKTDGYGETERTVGVNVKLAYSFVDEETNDSIKGTTVISFPWSFRKDVMLGDEMALVFASRGEA